MSTTTEIPTLPSDFAPGSKDVVIGKGKKFYFHQGNQWLRTVVAERISEYSQAVTKADKSSIISSVVEFVRENGRFVKLDNSGAWIYAEPLLCREKVSQTFRDNLAQTYRSSNVAKRNKRRQEQQEKTNFAVANMVLFPPQAKRIRTTYNSYSNTHSGMPALTPPSPTSSYQDMEPLPVPSSPTSCATWFDWEMPLFDQDLEPLSIQQQQQQQAEVSPKDFDGLFLDLTSNDASNVIDDFEPLPALSGSSSTVKPLKTGSANFVVDQSAAFRVGRNDQFQRRTAAAFAA